MKLQWKPLIFQSVKFGEVNIPFMLSIYTPDINGYGEDKNNNFSDENRSDDAERQKLIEELRGLIFLNPSRYNENNMDEGWETADEYLSGNVRSKLTLAETFKLLISNKYFVMICVVYILQQLRAAMLSVGTYFMTYVLFNQKLFGVFSWAINIPLIIALAITPTLVAKARGMYKLNKYSYVFATICRLGIVVAGYLGSIPLMLVFTVLTSLGEGPWQGDVGAVIANCSEHTYLKTGKRIDGSMFSCTSFGTKLGGGIGVALSGWLLDASGYVNNVAVQSASCISMMNVMYLWLPFAFDLIITIILSFMNIEGANEQLKESME